MTFFSRSYCSLFDFIGLHGYCFLSHISFYCLLPGSHLHVLVSVHLDKVSQNLFFLFRWGETGTSGVEYLMWDPNTCFLKIFSYHKKARLLQKNMQKIYIIVLQHCNRVAYRKTKKLCYSTKTCWHLKKKRQVMCASLPNVQKSTERQMICATAPNMRTSKEKQMMCGSAPLCWHLQRDNRCVVQHHCADFYKKLVMCDLAFWEISTAYVKLRYPETIDLIHVFTSWTHL